jgi:hypothetical protein
MEFETWLNVGLAGPLLQEVFADLTFPLNSIIQRKKHVHVLN